MAREFRAPLAVLLTLGLWAGLGSTVSAQTISQPTGDATIVGGGAYHGQSFTATITGTVTRIDVRSRTAGPFFLRLYNGGTGSGVSNSIGTPAFSQPVVLTDTGSDAVGFNPIVLSTPFPVTLGQQYTFVLDNGGGGTPPLSINTTAPYGGGTFRNASGSVDGWDLVFQVYESAPTPVPTMSEWSMILLSFLMAGGAALYIQRRRMFG